MDANENTPLLCTKAAEGTMIPMSENMLLCTKEAEGIIISSSEDTLPSTKNAEGTVIPDSETSQTDMDNQQKHARRMSYIALAGSMAMVFFQIIFQMYVSVLTHGLNDRLALSIAVGVPAVAEHIGDLLWIPITNDLDRVFHSRLIFVELGHKERDALRKCDSLDSVLRICLTKLPAIMFSLVQAYYRTAGISNALLFALILVVINIGSRVCAGQGRAIEDNWEKNLRRNDTLMGPAEYLKSQKILNRSRTMRGLADKGRSIAWAVCLLGVFCSIKGGPTIAVYGKILKDAYSLDGHLEKLLKSWIPTKTLIYAYTHPNELGARNQNKADNQNCGQGDGGSQTNDDHSSTLNQTAPGSPVYEE